MATTFACAGVERTWNNETAQAVTPMFTGYPGQIDPIPRLTHMLFEGMFFIITPALICGAFAERMKFSTMVLFTILWGTLVYCPLCIGFGGAVYCNMDRRTFRAGHWRRARFRRRHGRAYQLGNFGAGAARC